ncbi:hypothetical protein OHB54_46260 (plasmid) [Streptomyces sp. NBC_01007]|nr:hypothetical protein OHB54_46260 [Streptomyces sp. NBC_01007]
MGSPAAPTRTEKILSLIIAGQFGLIGALISFIILPHLGASVLAALFSASGCFVVITGGTTRLMKEIGLL